MIRINLLPYRPARRLRRLYTTLTTWAGIFLFGLLLLWGIDWWWLEEIQALQTRKKHNEQAIAALNEQLGEVKEINERKALALTRLEMIQRLSREQELTIRLLDAVARAIPEQAWLTRLESQKNQLLLTGMATSNAVVADFMRQLSASPHFRSVELLKVAKVEKKGQSESKELLNSFLLELQFAPLKGAENASPAPPTVTSGK
ncbi:MAG: PilN domain-containing protein [Magnetococcales bacterium]|nr:PilN domain-containing protein [Magnetococcales bacterium]MBF0114653.1 PilN domain-containing protein [Magnetococcales bacterium]